MRSLFSSKLFLSCLLAVVTFGASAQADILVTEGASPALPYLKAVQGQFGKETGHSINAKGNGSKAGVECLMKSECHVGFYIGEPAKETEATISLTPFAADGLIVTTSQDVTIDGLTKDQVVKIFTGKIKNWKEVGGKDAAIVVWQRRKASGVYDWFNKSFAVSPEAIIASQEVGSSNEMLFQMKSAKNTITYGSLSESMSSKAENFKNMKIEGVMPLEKTLQDSTYPFRQSMLLMRRKDQLKNDTINKLADFLMKHRQEHFKSVGMMMP